MKSLLRLNLQPPPTVATVFLLISISMFTIVQKENHDCKAHMTVKKFMIEKVKTIANEAEISTLWGAVQELAKRFEKPQEENAKLAKRAE